MSGVGAAEAEAFQFEIEHRAAMAGRTTE